MVLLIESDGINFVECPICHKEFKVITMTHLKVHGYRSKEEFLKDYPNTQLVSKNYEDSNREIRRNVLTKLNQSDEQRRKASAHAKELNKDHERQSRKGSQGWTDERRSKQSEIMNKVTTRVNNDPEFQEYRDLRLKGLSYGKRIPYITEDGRHLTLRSFLECRVCKFLELNNYDFEYESLEIPYVQGGNHNYYPDFYLKDFNLIIEVKPDERQDNLNATLKKEASESQGYNFMFVSDTDLKNYDNLINKINALHAK